MIWTAASGAHPVISGGVPITGWTRVDPTRNVWSAPASSTSTGRGRPAPEAPRRYGSALWAVDQEMLVASLGVIGENFHSNIALCGGPKPPGAAYTPFCGATTADAAAGTLIPQPEYYALRMLQEIGTGNFAPIDSTDTTNLRSYAVKRDTRLRLVLDNLGASRTVTVNLGGTYTQGDLIRLTGPRLTATTGITLGGGTVRGDGTFSGATHTRVSVSGTILTLTLPATTATLLTLNP